MEMTINNLQQMYKEEQQEQLKHLENLMTGQPIAGKATDYDAKTNDWTVGSDGTMSHKRYYYIIEGRSLYEGNWLDHMMQKTWVDMNTFVPAFLEACSRARVEEVRVKY